MSLVSIFFPKRKKNCADQNTLKRSMLHACNKVRFCCNTVNNKFEMNYYDMTVLNQIYAYILDVTL